MIPHHESQTEILRDLETSAEKGLSSNQVTQRLKQYGENRLNERKKKTICNDF